MKEEIDVWLKKNNKFKVLITGRTGTGKTTLIKGLKENYVPSEDNLLPSTKNVKEYVYEFDKINFHLFDTPGFRDATSKNAASNDYKYLNDMVEKNEEPDLILFVIKMDNARFSQEDTNAIEKISHAFGWKSWKNAMFLLSFANKVSKPGVKVDSRENQVYYQKRQADLSIHITKTLRDNKVPDAVANSIPVIPVGLVNQPHIPSSGSKESWIDVFWSEVFQVLKSRKQNEEVHTFTTIKDSCNCTKICCDPTLKPKCNSSSHSFAARMCNAIVFIITVLFISW